MSLVYSLSVWRSPLALQDLSSAWSVSGIGLESLLLSPTEDEGNCSMTSDSVDERAKQNEQQEEGTEEEEAEETSMLVYAASMILHVLNKTLNLFV